MNHDVCNLDTYFLKGKKMLRSTTAVVSLALLSSSVLASSAFYASTDRVSYTGSLTKYSTLADAQAATNAVGTYAIPNRATATPYDTGSRDAAFWVTNNYPGEDSNLVFLTSWWYTTVENTNSKPKDDPDGNREYSGYGNPNNTNTGFLQLYDEGADTVQNMSGSFSSFDGTYWTDFTLSASGENADYANSYARLWHAPGTGGAGGLTVGTFLKYELDITFKGLEGIQLSPGVIESNNHPTDVVGTFKGIYQNTNTLDAAYNGFYVIDYTFNMDNWAFGMGDDALNGNFSPSYFAVVPVPAAAWAGMSTLAGMGGLAFLRRRKAQQAV